MDLVVLVPDRFKVSAAQKSSEIFLSSIRLLIFSRLSDNFDALKGRNDGERTQMKKNSEIFLSPMRLLILSRLFDNFDALKGRNARRKEGRKE